MKKVTSFLLLTIFSFIFGQVVLAVGQMSQPINIENAVRGEIYEEQIMMVNSGDEQVTFKLLAEGDIAEWTSFYEIDDKENPITYMKVDAKGSKNAFVRFTIPEDSANGLYNGYVSVITVPGEEEGGEEKTKITVSQRIPRSVQINVSGEEIIDYNIHIYPDNLRLADGESLKINVIYQNKGNISVKPLIQQKIIKNDEIISNIIHPYPEDLKPIIPNESKTLPIKWDTKNAERGEYQTEITVLLGDKVIKTKLYNFSIGNQGVVLGAVKINSQIIWPLAGVVLIIIFVLVLLIVKKRLATAKSN